jgi:hypothetical protein
MIEVEIEAPAKAIIQAPVEIPKVKEFETQKEVNSDLNWAQKLAVQFKKSVFLDEQNYSEFEKD